MTLKSSVVIFQALTPLQPQWPQWPQQPQWPQWPQQPHFIKKSTDPDGLIIPGSQMTNTSPFLWNGSSKIQFFTDIWYTFCPRLVRPACVTFLKTGWWNSNAQTSGTFRYLHYNLKVLFSWPLRSSKYIKVCSNTLYTIVAHFMGWILWLRSDDFWNISKKRQLQGSPTYVVFHYCGSHYRGFWLRYMSTFSWGPPLPKYFDHVNGVW